MVGMVGMVVMAEDSVSAQGLEDSVLAQGLEAMAMGQALVKNL
jgi:hypothetical protein